MYGGIYVATTALSEDSAKSRYFALRPSIKSIVYLS